MKSIAIDGPAGAGKSTIARKVAEKLSFIYVDTGAMYRSMALYFIRHDIAAQDEEKIAAACPDIDVSIVYQDGEQQVILNGENVNGLIRTEQVSMMTSDTSKYPVVREKLLSLQRGLAEKENVIMDGRDIGYKEQTERGVDCDIKEIERDIIARDEQDMNREVAPLRQAEDAVLVDSSDMTIDQVVDEIIRIYQEKTV